jgi:ketosteroid isomerase-like protein
MPDDFEAFLKTREAAARAYTKGNPAPLVALSAISGQATFFDPGGGFTEGAQAVIDTNTQGAKSFGPNGITRFEIHDHGASGDLGFWTGFQLATVEIDGKQQDMRIRITEVFRRISGEWKLVHRHASMAKADT